MAPVKPMGVGQQPQTRPGVTGFVQEYNQEAPKPTELNPDAVTDASALAPPRTTADALRTRKTARKSTRVKK